MALGNLIPWKRRKGNIKRRREYDNLIDSFYHEMNNLFDRFFRDSEREPYSPLEAISGDFKPSVDIRESDNEIKVTAELPGMEEKDIEITITKDSLTIKGKKEEETEDKGKDYYHLERTYGSFYRMIPLPVEIDENKAEATYKKGVLYVKLPKTPGAKSERKKVSVKST